MLPEGLKVVFPAGNGIPGLGRHVLRRAVHAVVCDGVRTGMLGWEQGRRLHSRSWEFWCPYIIKNS